MSITIEFLQIFAAIAALIGFSLAVGVAIGKGSRPDDHTAEDDAEQIEYLKQADEQVATRKRLAAYKPYPNTESKS